jgi:hypothetical protein
MKLDLLLHFSALGWNGRRLVVMRRVFAPLGPFSKLLTCAGEQHTRGDRGMGWF